MSPTCRTIGQNGYLWQNLQPITRPRSPQALHRFSECTASIPNGKWISPRQRPMTMTTPEPVRPREPWRKSTTTSVLSSFELRPDSRTTPMNEDRQPHDFSLETRFGLMH